MVLLQPYAAKMKRPEALHLKRRVDRSA